MENIAKVKVMQISRVFMFTLLFLCRKMNCYKQELVSVVQTASAIYILPFSLSIIVFHFTEKKCQHDFSDDSGIFTESKSTAFSGVSYCLP